MKRPNIMDTKLRADEYRTVLNPITTSMLALRLGTADENDRNTIAAAINFAYEISNTVQRHRHLVPLVKAASDAAIAGWHDLDAIDTAMEVYKGMIRTTPRRTVAKCMQRVFTRTKT